MKITHTSLTGIISSLIATGILISCSKSDSSEPPIIDVQFDQKGIAGLLEDSILYSNETTSPGIIDSRRIPCIIRFTMPDEKLVEVYVTATSIGIPNFFEGEDYRWWVIHVVLNSKEHIGGEFKTKHDVYEEIDRFMDRNDYSLLPGPKASIEKWLSEPTQSTLHTILIENNDEYAIAVSAMTVPSRKEGGLPWET